MPNPLDKAPFIIADVGSNHRGSFELALKHIEAAKECGCDAVKFQMYTYEELYGRPAPTDYDRRYELPRDWVPKLKEHADKVGIEFTCTAFSVDGYKFVDPYVNVHKVASAEVLHEGIWKAIAETQKPFLVSTGGTTKSEILGMLGPLILEARDNSCFFLNCVSAYPAATSDYDLNWQWDNGNLFFHGISDHTLGNVLACTAVGKGVTIFEKHFELECASKEDTPDSCVSVDSVDLASYCAAIHEAFSCLGDGIKRPRESEADFVKYHRRLRGLDTFRPGVK